MSEGMHQCACWFCTMVPSVETMALIQRMPTQKASILFHLPCSLVQTAAFTLNNNCIVEAQKTWPTWLESLVIIPLNKEREERKLLFSSYFSKFPKSE